MKSALHTLAVVALLSFAPAVLIVPMHAVAEEAASEQKTRRVPSMSEATYKKLAEAQELLDAKDYNGARAILQGMLDRDSRYNGNEIGQIHNMLGFMYFSQERYEDALREYKIVAAQGDEIPEGLETTTLYTIAQLSFVAEQYQDALKYMQMWIAKANNPGPEPHIFMGQVYYQMKDYPNAIKQIETGISIARDRGTAVKENWWQLLTFLHYERENWPKVMEILEILVRDFPKRDYWIQLAGVQGQEGREKQQIYTMEAAYVGGFLSRESDITSLAGLLMQDEVPYRAALVLQKGFEDKLVQRTDKNLQALGQAYQLAQEVDKAIPVLEEAGRLSDSGQIFERLAYLYLEDDEFKKCITAAENALDKGGLRKKHNVFTVKGMCEYNLDRLSTGRGSFVACRDEARRARDSSNERVCAQWITFIDRENERRQQLAAAG
jgi:tetratricopeptide (TPR) repeat protein